MSGSGSSGGTGGGAGGTTGTVDCTNIFEETTLASPVPEVLQRLQVGQILRLQLQQPPRGPLLAVTDQGETAGSITTTSLTRLIICINDGHQFVALVRAVSGGKCDVEIRSAGTP